MENRKDFFQQGLNMDRVEEVLKDVITRLSLEEVLKMTREITYDMVSGERLYNGSYSQLNIEQANAFQAKIRDACDMFAQSIVDKREFDENYLKDYAYARPYLRIIEKQKERIANLEEQLKYGGEHEDD